jgi:N-acetylmuramic acid 6-phosphate etherase
LKSSPRENLARLGSERSNPAADDLDRKSSLQIARVINAEDAKVARAVKATLPQIARAIDWTVDALSQGGRLVYVGAGTSGRIAALDAAECPPTFNVDSEKVQFIIAGGPKALGSAVEANEDSRELGEREIAKKRPGRKDVVIGIAASGRTPFTLAAIEYARKRGARTVAITCNPKSPLEQAAELAIVVEVGPEVIAGSSRMKAGTAQKMVLNLISTGAMTRLGYVYGNLMVNVHPKNFKLTERALGIISNITGENRAAAESILKAAGSVPVAVVMHQAVVSRSEAERALQSTGGNVRRAITLAQAGHNESA